MKHDLDIVDPLVLKLGQTVREISQSDYDLIGRVIDRVTQRAAFERIDFGGLRGITEADCRQVTIELEPAGSQTHDSRITQSVVLPLTSPQEAQSLAEFIVRGLMVTRVRTISPGCAFTAWVKT